MREVTAIKIALPLLQIYPWAIPTIVILGILSSLSEGVGISLFIPFLQSLNQPTSLTASGSFLAGFLNSLFDHISYTQKTLIIPLCILGCVLIKNLLTYSTSILSSWLYFRLSHYLISGVFNQLLSVSYSFLDSKPSGKLLNTIDIETWRTCDAISLLVNIVISACTIFVFIILLMLVSWQLTLLVAIALALISFGVQGVTRKASALGQQAVKASDNLAKRVMEGFYGLRVIRAFGREAYEQERFDRSLTQVRANFMKLHQLYAMTGPLSEVLCVALLVGIMIIALQYKTSLPTLLTFIFMLYRIQPSVRKLDSDRVNFLGLTASIEDVMSLLNCADKPYIRSGQVRFKGLKQAISFENVTFRYHQNEKPAIENMTIRIPQGKTTAIVGPSGAGKSTFIGLICRFYDVTEGKIYVDDHLLHQIDLADWRSQIAIVNQDVHLFSTTIWENIAYGKLDATKDEIIAAAKQANADEFISKLPQGYDTVVGDRGIRLSGGQRQRIALSRAIIRDPELLILDEATNALDSASEHSIQEAIYAFSQNRTVIVVAHRLATIEKADQIVVLEQGRVVEQGNLQQLLNLNGLFAKLYQLQYRRSA